MSVPDGPLTTSTCSMLNMSREIEPRSRTPSTKMLLGASKPRMKIESPVLRVAVLAQEEGAGARGVAQRLGQRGGALLAHQLLQDDLDDLRRCRPAAR